jgi:hypothetical protein
MGSNEFHVPGPTPDAGLACLRAAPLPDNGIRVETMRGTRILALDEDGTGIPDLSEPTEESGWTEEVDGRPARLVVVAGAGPDQPAETRTWDVLLPGSLDGVFRIRADIAGPDLEAGRAVVQRIVDAVDFKTSVRPLEDSEAIEILRAFLDNLERTGRDSGSDLYGCFPREPGIAEGTIRGGVGGPLAGPLDVTCTTAIRPSLAEVWRIVLEVSWDGTDAYAGDVLRQEFFTTGQEYSGQITWNGGYVTAGSGRSAPDAGSDAWFPNAGYELPAPRSAPLNLAPGAIVRMLWPGEYPQPEPGRGDGAISPSMVNTHLSVIDGPEIIDGEEWYRVQWGGGALGEPGWLRGSRDGRPQLEVVQPECPDASLTVGDLTWLTAAERLACFATVEVTLPSGVLVSDEAWEGAICASEDGTETACPDPLGEPAWLTGFPRWKLYGAGGPFGPEPGLFVWLDPSIGEPTSGQAVRIRGHFDDPAASACRLPNVFGPNHVADAALDRLICRERLVVTAIEPQS